MRLQRFPERTLLKARVIGEGTFLGILSLTEVERPLIVAGQVQRLDRKDKVDAFGIKALHGNLGGRLGGRPLDYWLFFPNRFKPSSSATICPFLTA
ncbi:MAG: hypothetical protein QNJ58_15010 [Desulfobacterales bacterium]|nr:hypothetical protein [Desulfobacterales bacterium]